MEVGAIFVRMHIFWRNDENYLEIITCPPSRNQAYRLGSSIFARGPLGPRANMECRAGIPGNATVDMF